VQNEIRFVNRLFQVSSARALRKQGHDVRLIAAQFVKSNKNDFVDAEAIAEAVERKNMRFVPIKTDDQLDLPAARRRRAASTLAQPVSARGRANPCDPLGAWLPDAFLSGNDRCGGGLVGGVAVLREAMIGERFVDDQAGAVDTTERLVRGERVSR